MNEVRPKSVKELMADMKKKAEKIRKETANTETISRLCRLFREAKEEVTIINGKNGLVQILKDQKSETMKKTIDTMKSEGVSAQVVDGYSYSISPIDKYSVLVENHPKRDDWLNEIGAGIQTNTYMIAGDEMEFLSWINKKWKEENGDNSVPPISRYGTDVHHRTFSNFIKDVWPDHKKGLPEPLQKLPPWINEYHGEEIRMKKKNNKKGE